MALICHLNILLDNNLLCSDFCEKQSCIELIHNTSPNMFVFQVFLLHMGIFIFFIRKIILPIRKIQERFHQNMYVTMITYMMDSHLIAQQYRWMVKHVIL